MAVDAALEECGASVSRTRVGDVFVAACTDAPDVVFGGEPSGAWIWPDELPCPDGPLAACRLAALVTRAGPLSDQIRDLPEYPIVRENIEVAIDAKAATMDRISTRVTAEYGDVTTVDGVRAEVDDGWFLIRPSGTQPLIRVTAQAENPDRAQAIASTARQIVSNAMD